VSREAALLAVVDRVRGLFRPYDVDIVTTPPAAGAYTEVLVGGSQRLVSSSSGTAGLSVVDCADRNPSNVVFDFADDEPADRGGLVAVALTAAHEAGHSYGLEHTDNPTDVMYQVAAPMQTLEDLFRLSFTVGNYSPFSATGSAPEACGHADPLDNDALLAAALGRRTGGDATPPELTWRAPDGTDVKPTFTVAVDASDDVGVARVEVWVDFGLVASLSAPPFTAAVEVASGRAFALTVEAIDAAGNRRPLTRRLTASLAPSPADMAPSCDGRCAPPPARGCAVGGRARGDATLPLWLLACAALRRWRRRAAAG
jgi:hypothetical protein